MKTQLTLIAVVLPFPPPLCQSNTMTTFNEIGVSGWLERALSGVSISQPTEIQRNCIPKVLSGYNVIGAAQTGSGKSLAFALPVLQELAKDPYGVFAVVLTPTRELAMQIANQFKVLGVHCSLRLSLIVGGVDMMTQAIELQKRPHVVVATPGRLADHLKSSSAAVDLGRLRFLILDEADKLLENESLREDLKTILMATSGVYTTRFCQTLLFSATINPNQELLDQLWSHGRVQPSEKPTFCYASTAALSNNLFSTVDKLDQRYLPTPKPVRNTYLVYLLTKTLKDKTAVVFVNKCRTCEFLRCMLKELGFQVAALHAQMPQKMRTLSLTRFKSNTVKILIATDVGSRGLDIPQAEAVVNFNLPLKSEDYVHRVGRTARAGRGGLALSLVGRHDFSRLLDIERDIGTKLQEYETFDENEALKLLNKVTASTRSATLTLLENKFGERQRLYKLKTLRGSDQ